MRGVRLSGGEEVPVEGGPGVGGDDGCLGPARMRGCHLKWAVSPTPWCDFRGRCWPAADELAAGSVPGDAIAILGGYGEFLGGTGRVLGGWRHGGMRWCFFCRLSSSSVNSDVAGVLPGRAERSRFRGGRLVGAGAELAFGVVAWRERCGRVQMGRTSTARRT